MAFPETGILDNFNRANDSTPPPGANWETIYNGHDIYSNTLRGHTASDANVSGWIGDTYGPSVEMYISRATAGGYEALYFLDESGAGYAVGADYSNDEVNILRIDEAGVDEEVLETFSVSQSPYGSVGMHYDSATTTIYAYYKASGGAWTQEGSVVDDTYSGMSAFTIFTYDTAAYDNFGGGTLAAGGETVQIGAGTLIYAMKALGVNAETHLPVGNTSIAYAGSTLGINIKEDVPIAQGAVTYAGKPFKVNEILKIGAAAITYVGQVLSVAADEVVSIGSGAISYAGQIFKVNEVIKIGAAAIAYAGRAIGVIADETVQIGNASITYAGRALNVLAGNMVAIGAAAIQYAGQVFKVNEVLKIGAAAITYAGKAVTANAKEAVEILGGAITYAGKSFKQNVVIHIGKATISYAGRSITVLVGGVGDAVKRSKMWVYNMIKRRKG